MLELLFFLQTSAHDPNAIDWTEYWIGVAIGWVILLGTAGYVLLMLKMDKEEE
ncbi:MAG: hypothetical protein HC893_08815 [Chloroflexaceae bacterium]|nr:hypothetical protein [Chloroflexaceae bacterium]NJL33933.1 hypothetical protein [Chloroflexaceae bacterium]NJO06403.1 hypothetical protein [Chloroflexaceae bacterium]